MAWISEEAERELQKRREEQQELTNKLVKARNNPWHKEKREAFFPETSYGDGK